MGVFATKQTHGGSYRSDQMTLAINGTDVTGMVLQNVQYTFTQQVGLVYEIGSDNVYYVGGRANGNSGIQRLLGPKGASSNIVMLLNDICLPSDLTFKIKGKGNNVVGPVGPVQPSCIQIDNDITLKRATLTAVSGQINSDNTSVTEGLQLIFLDMTYPGVN
jgi:hypothetical protein